MSYYTLLTRPDSQPKAIKGQKKGIMTFVLHLSPSDLSGHEVCPCKTASCVFFCINVCGRGGMIGPIGDHVQGARLRKTKWFFADRDSFMQALVSDIRKAIRHAARKGFDIAIRLNGTSDIPWHRIPVNNAESVMHLFPEIQFYDYTKVAKRILKETLPSNYDLTFSLTESNDNVAAAILARGGKVAAIFRDKATVQRAIDRGFMGAPVVNGDETDIRFLDPRGSVIALFAKGKAKKHTGGMVRDIAA